MAAAKNNKSAPSQSTSRRSDKADVLIASPTKEQQERKAHKLAERTRRQEARRAARHEAGPSVTMPKISWEWATEMMVRRWPNTRRARTVNAVFVHEGRRVPDDTPIETSKKNGR